MIKANSNIVIAMANRKKQVTSLKNILKPRFSVATKSAPHFLTHNSEIKRIYES
jgi:hypothetical protein